jgi:SPASM domain peptide maturase of grasp-with-spasm system
MKDHLKDLFVASLVKIIMDLFLRLKNFINPFQKSLLPLQEMKISDRQDYFSLYANCIPVKGALRSVLYDLQLNRYRFIPNLLYDILIDNPKQKVKAIKKRYKGQFNKGIDLFFDQLTKENFGFYSESVDNFPKLDLAWESPLKITNSIIDIGETTSYDHLKVLNQLSKINCEGLQIRIFKTVSIEFLNLMLDTLVHSSFIYIEIILKSSRFCSTSKLNEILKKHARVRIIYIYNSKEKKIIRPDGLAIGSLVYLKENIPNELHCGVINETYFNTNIELFTESLHYNNCLNKKISVDVNGNIKNCPSMKSSYGNVNSSSIETAIALARFKDLWFIKKDEIDVCKDCEFRYMCTDCRAYIEDENNTFSKPKKCTYDPYKGAWN